MEELAAEARVSKALIYYYFEDHAGLLRHTLEFISDRAERYTGGRSGPARPSSPRRELEQSFLLEFQEVPEVRENSTAWGELRASAVFDPQLQDELARAGLMWVREVADALGRTRTGAPDPALIASAERLTALLEGLSARWLSGILPLGNARELMREAIAVEVEQLGRHPAHGAPPRPRPAVASHTLR